MFYQTSILFFVVGLGLGYELTSDEQSDNTKYKTALNWFHCSDEDSKKGLSLQVMKTCSPVIPHFNQCCAVHDDCYDLQYKKEKCDDAFYYCNENAVNKYAKWYHVCWTWVKGSYALLSLGDGAYAEAMLRKYRRPYYIPTGSGITPNVTRFFSGIYQNCEFHRIVISSCAFYFEECVINNQGSCGEKLMKCFPDGQEGGPSHDGCQNNYIGLREEMQASYS